ncbi:hypothetical protein AV530_015675 [Patagioenas fasciata monilis]|uniref:Uncharacterized protein n=1 Tax=Patagioenas fasciata monilis TaxID=372326 RepID=A0A1V4KID6_PATFA|nr:hypothetical protein AV530_015675 [Patagioenas fasciata monilis]
MRMILPFHINYVYCSKLSIMLISHLHRLQFHSGRECQRKLPSSRTAAPFCTPQGASVLVSWKIELSYVTEDKRERMEEVLQHWNPTNLSGQLLLLIIALSRHVRCGRRSKQAGSRQVAQVA